MDINFELPTNIDVEKIKADQLDLVLSYPKTKVLIEAQNIPLETVKKYLNYFVKVVKDDLSLHEDDSLLNKELNGFISGISYDKKSNTITQTYAYIPKRAELEKIKNKYLIREIEEDVFNYTLKDCLKHFRDERTPLISKLAIIAKNGKANKGIYIDGDPETGKSFILAVFSKFLGKLDSTSDLVFIDCNREFEYAKNLYEKNREQFDDYLVVLQKTQYLFIDDFGKEYKQAFNFTNILIPVLEYRKEHHLLTFFTSSFRPTEIPSIYRYGKEMSEASKKLSHLILDLTEECQLKGMKYYF